MGTQTRVRRAWLAAGILLLSACGSDDEPAAGADTTTTEADETSTTVAGPGSIEVEGQDYKFVGLPAEIKAGTTLSLRNSSAGELHELVMVRINDGETRSVEELLALPEEESAAAMEEMPAAVILSLPGQINTPGAVLGDGTITEPGRYVAICGIPLGADPQAYVDAAATSPGPPDVEGGPPHFTEGMWAEVSVT